MTGTAGGIVQSGRRAFLKWATAVGGALSGLLAGVPALRAFPAHLWPSPGRTAPQHTVVCILPAKSAPVL